MHAEARAIVPTLRSAVGGGLPCKAKILQARIGFRDKQFALPLAVIGIKGGPRPSTILYPKARDRGCSRINQYAGAGPPNDGGPFP